MSAKRFNLEGIGKSGRITEIYMCIHKSLCIATDEGLRGQNAIHSLAVLYNCSDALLTFIVLNEDDGMIPSN